MVCKAKKNQMGEVQLGDYMKDSFYAYQLMNLLKQLDKGKGKCRGIFRGRCNKF